MLILFYLDGSDDQQIIPVGGLNENLLSEANTVPPCESSHPSCMTQVSDISSPKLQLKEYCKRSSKPPPKYKTDICEGGSYKSNVYVAKTVGWVEGLKCTSKDSAEISATVELLKRLKTN